MLICLYINVPMHLFVDTDTHILHQYNIDLQKRIIPITIFLLFLFNGGDVGTINSMVD